MTTEYDVVVVGSGVAGLSVALGLAGTRRVAIITSGPIESGSTAWAQGGLAAAVAPDDDALLHGDDTVLAGAGVCDEGAVAVLTDGAATSLADLVRAGAKLDHNQDGRLALTREGGHHRHRVVHAGGDATGAEVSRALSAAVHDSLITVIDNAAVETVTTTSTRHGVRATGVTLRRNHGSPRQVSAAAVVLATGGVGGLYASSTNPPEVSGGGLGLALRAGATLVDVEFVQFHPTALRLPGNVGQIPLVTEALRGEGAVLRGTGGDRIMAGRHPLGDLAPRDIVARRIDEVLASGSAVGLDATELGDALLRDRFPTVYNACRSHGIDPAAEPIPVAPAQHFLCGGVQTDRWGATDVAGLYAVGEVAATGVHGANRLASNSLIEAMVFGRRLAARLVLDLPTGASTDADTSAVPVIDGRASTTIRTVMTKYAGIRRSAAGLRTALQLLDAVAAQPAGDTCDAQVGNQWLAASAVLAASQARRESRGCHWRSDYPIASTLWRRHIAVRLDDSGIPVAVATTAPRERTA